MNNDLMFSSKTDMWATPQDFFDKMSAEFEFNLDVCATKENAKCPRYFTEQDDGLKQEWGGGFMLVQSAVWQKDWRMG